MRTILLLLILMVWIPFSFGQAPQSFKYQAVARDASGGVLAGKNVSFKISILQGSVTGTSVYSELHAVTTNAFGLVELNIGQGTSPSSVFANINWASGTYFVKVELDPLGGVTFYHMGTSQLLSVPYSLLSKKTEEIPDNVVTNAKIANNAVNISKLPLGATATTFLRGDGTWATPAGLATPGGVNGNVQFNNSGSLGGTSDLFWDNTNKKLGVGISSPSAKLHIYGNSAPTDPHLKLYENSSDYARLSFQNSNGSNYWLLSGFNSTTNTGERFKITNSTFGDAFIITGDGKIGINCEPGPFTSRITVNEDVPNRYAIYAISSSNYPTVFVRNNSTGAAGYFQNNSTLYTLYATNSGSGPAAYFDGTLQISGGNTSEINRSQTGSANVVPICFGSVEGIGTKNSGGTSNFTVTVVSTGVYDITIAGETYSQNTHTAIASLGDPGFVNLNEESGKLRVYTYNTSGSSAAREFSFMVYKP